MKMPGRLAYLIFVSGLILFFLKVVGGVLAGTENSAEDLRSILLNRHRLNFNLKTAFEIGLPGILRLPMLWSNLQNPPYQIMPAS